MFNGSFVLSFLSWNSFLSSLFSFTDCPEIAAPVKLRIILRQNDSHRMILPEGIPESVSEQIKWQCETSFDTEFGNEFTSFPSISIVQDKSSMKSTFNSVSRALPGGSLPPHYSAASTSRSLDDSSSLSSGSSCNPDTPQDSLYGSLSSSCSSSYSFKESSSLLNPDTKLYSATFDGLAETIEDKMNLTVSLRMSQKLLYQHILVWKVQSLDIVDWRQVWSINLLTTKQNWGSLDAQGEYSEYPHTQTWWQMHTEGKI